MKRRSARPIQRRSFRGFAFRGFASRSRSRSAARTGSQDNHQPLASSSSGGPPDGLAPKAAHVVRPPHLILRSVSRPPKDSTPCPPLEWLGACPAPPPRSIFDPDYRDQGPPHFLQPANIATPIPSSPARLSEANLLARYERLIDVPTPRPGVGERQPKPTFKPPASRRMFPVSPVRGRSIPAPLPKVEVHACRRSVAATISKYINAHGNFIRPYHSSKDEPLSPTSPI